MTFPPTYVSSHIPCRSTQLIQTRLQFVYPFTLEPHILAQDPPIHEKIRMQRDRYASLLVTKAQESEARRFVHFVAFPPLAFSDAIVPVYQEGTVESDRSRV